jgi:hypothetical protein
VTAALAQRQVVLAGVALLGAILALALASRGGDATMPGLPRPVPAPGGGWYTALAGAGPARYGHRTRCNILLRPSTIGVIDSVLPCGIKVYVAFEDSPQVLTQVIDRRPVAPRRKFELTPKLAEQLGVDGVQRIRWAFAR